MPRLTSSDRVCYPRVECHAMSDVVRLCVLPKGGDVMPRLMLSDRACSPRAFISYHAGGRLTVCAVQGR